MNENENPEVIDPEVMPGDQSETRVTIAGSLTAQIADVARYAMKRIEGAEAWLAQNGVTAANADEAKKLRTSVNYAEKDAADKRKEIQKAVASLLADAIQPLVDAEKKAKCLSSMLKAAIDALNVMPRMFAPHYVEIVCDQDQWAKLTKAIGKEVHDGGSFSELDPKWVRIPKELRGGNVPV